MIDPNEHDQFLLRQRWAPVINRYQFTRGDPERTLDRRLLLATAVGMDALQAR